MCPAYEDFRGLFDANGQWIPKAWERAEAGMVRWIMRRVNAGGSRHNSTDQVRESCHDGVVDAMAWFEAQKRQPNAFRVLRYAFKASLSHVIKRDKKTPRSVSTLGTFDAPEPGASDSASSFELNEDVQAFMRKLDMIDLCIFQSLLHEEHDQSEIARKSGIRARTLERRRAKLRERFRRWFGIEKKNSRRAKTKKRSSP